MDKAAICEFAKEYAASGTVRLHMPGHKGVPLLGCEPYDLTEIKGADYLYEASGIIRQSEERTAALYGTAATFYSTEGSSLSIKTMLAVIKHRISGRPKIAAARNCHRAFINACILLDLEPVWVYPEKESSCICSSSVTPEDIERTLSSEPKCKAVYITSPDYTGRMADIRGISEVCKRHGAYLLVDNAHGAYLKFCSGSLHPIDLGADMCADSAHKTLPCLTGGSYLHISKNAPAEFAGLAKSEMALFASTSPSYIIMQSLDLCAEELSDTLPERIRSCCCEIASLKQRLSEHGFSVVSGEPMKLTIEPRSFGYSGGELADILRQSRIECEYSDPGCIVLMPSPYNSREDLERLEAVLCGIERRPALPDEGLFTVPKPERALLPREAYFKPYKTVPADQAEGLICARAALSCQPSIPLIVGGEVFDKNIIKILKNYSILEVNVLQ